MYIHFLLLQGDKILLYIENVSFPIIPAVKMYANKSQIIILIRLVTNVKVLEFAS